MRSHVQSNKKAAREESGFRTECTVKRETIEIGIVMVPGNDGS